MKAYEFRLASVAHVRALEERVARDRFMVSQRGVRRAEDAVHGAESALRSLEVPGGTMTPADFVWIGDQAERLSSSVRARRQAVVEARSRRDEAHRAWNLAAKRSGVLERLDAQELARWRVESLRREAAELDDLAQVRHGRRGAVA